MADVLAAGLSWLADELVANASETVRYARGSDAVMVQATFGRKLLKLDDGDGGFRLEWTDLDFMIRAADLAFASGYGALVEPERGDTVTIFAADGITVAEVYEVRPYGTDPAWRWCDPFGKMRRVHCKRVA